MPEHRDHLPVVPTLWVRLLVHGDQREALLGDLEEDHRGRLARGERGARRRYWSDALGSACRLAGRSSRPTVRPIPTRGDSTIFQLVSDLRLAGRQVRRSPGFSLVVMLTLALGIGSLTAVFTLADGVVFRPLPFPDAGRLVRLFGCQTETGEGMWNSSYPDFADFRQRARSFESLDAYNRYPMNVAGHAERPERLDVATATHGLFEQLGVTMERGRDLAADDDRLGAEPVAVISESFWKLRLGADPDVLQHHLSINTISHAIIGVARGPVLPESVGIWIPQATAPGADVRGVHNLRVIGRMADGKSLEQAQAEVAAIAGQLATEYPRENATRGARLVPMQEAMVGDLRQPFSLLLGAAGLVLLIVCANVSNLLLHRAAGRSREVATRAALGAGGWQLLRQTLAESSWLVAGGGVLGLAFAWLGQGIVIAGVPDSIRVALPRLGSVGLDWRVLLFLLLVTALVAVVFALVPILEVTRRDLFAQLGAGARDVGSRGRELLRRSLVVVEVALAVVLVVGAGLLIRSLGRLNDVDPGFRSDHLLVMELELPTPFVSDDWPRTLAFYDRLYDTVRAMPGIESVTSGFNHPASPGWTSSFTVEGEPPPEEGHEPEANWRPVSEGYFEAMGIPLLRGRAFTPRDDAHSHGVAVVNQAFVDTYLPADRAALGRRLAKASWWIEQLEQVEIVGVVSNVHFSGRQLDPQPAIYFPHRQFPVPVMSVLVRTSGDPMSALPAVRQAVWSIDPDLPIGKTATMDELMVDTLAYRRFMAHLLSFFAGSALFLAGLGLYGVLAYSTARRTREIGIRMAIGASRADVLGLVLGQCVGLTTVGLVGGLAGAALLTKLLDALLFGVERSDPQTLAAVVGVAFALSLLAAYLPARRALGIDPTRALREE